MYEACKSTCHEWTSKIGFANYREDIVIEKEELIKKKEIKKEILREKKKHKKAHYESELWNAIEVNNELTLNVDDQQNDIKHLKEQCDDENVVQEITAAITPWKMPVFVTCKKNMYNKKWVAKHIQEEHTELWWDCCGKLFRNKKEVDNHMNEAWK